MPFLEREPFGDIDGDSGEEAGLADYLAGVRAEGMREALENDPVARLHYVRFKSESAGRGRKRKHPKIVELIGWGRKKCFELKEDGSRGLDRMAEEVLRGIVPPDRTLDELIQRARALDGYRRIARGER